MSKGSLLCLLVLLQVCIVQLPVISSRQLTGGQIADGFLCRDPIWRSRLMSNHGREGGEAAADEEEGLLSSEDEYGDRGEDKEDSSSSKGDVQCPECNKFFKNDKSMFGHLRSHPNRGYKGATPPVKRIKLSPETAVTSSLQGSELLPAYRSKRDPQLTPLEVLCAYMMLTLKYRGDSAPHDPHLLSSPPASIENTDSFAQPEGGTYPKANNFGPCDQHGNFIVQATQKRRQIDIPKQVGEARRKKVKLVPTPKEKRPYICKHCNEEFPTHQALGGHMAGHHREKKVPTLNQSMSSQSMENGKQQVKGGGADGEKVQTLNRIMSSQSLNNRKKQVKDGGADGAGWHNISLSQRRGLLSEPVSVAQDVPCQSRKASGGQTRQHFERTNDGLSPTLVEPTPTLNDDGDGRRLLNIDLNVEAQEQE